MAEITQNSRTCVTFYRSAKGAPHIVGYIPSTAIASTGFVGFGQVVQFDVNTGTNAHKIVRASTATPVLSTVLVGVAAEPDSSNVGQKIAIYQADPDAEFKFPTKATGAVHTSTLIGQRKALAWDSTNAFHFLDTANSTAGDARLLVTDVLDPGTTNGYVVAKFLSTATAFVAGSK